MRISDWGSDVCSSDLSRFAAPVAAPRRAYRSQRGGRLHHRPPVVRKGAELDRIAAATQHEMQRLAGDRGRKPTKGEAGERIVAEAPLRKVEQQGRGERSVDDEAAIALFGGRIGKIIMDAEIGRAHV